MLPDGTHRPPSLSGLHPRHLTTLTHDFEALPSWARVVHIYASLRLDVSDFERRHHRARALLLWGLLSSSRDSYCTVHLTLGSLDDNGGAVRHTPPVRLQVLAYSIGPTPAGCRGPASMFTSPPHLASPRARSCSGASGRETNGLRLQTRQLLERTLRPDIIGRLGPSQLIVLISRARSSSQPTPGPSLPNIASAKRQPRATSSRSSLPSRLAASTTVDAPSCTPQPVPSSRIPVQTLSFTSLHLTSLHLTSSSHPRHT